MSGRYPSRTGTAQGATGLFTVTVVKPGPTRGVIEHWAYDDRAHALDEIGWIAERVAPGTELVLRDPEGNDLFRVARTA
ncbi:hypothetical protein [Falsiroseomonas selenitidurans]|uniref:Glyoxalase-like domain-containing protein n=1 Tax=Falsiroseomonas selenitidurans TaxID=2716335 RepID=A0ABX1E602_9PROT|nr:hypothetical protein [Falsiroseomonas selenitidurans]NKC32615.1 hypothetical protein [Falsiroseomonas selenitidurans]